MIDGALRQKDSRIFLGKIDFPNVLWQAFPTSLLTGDIMWYLLPGRGNRPAARSLHFHLKHPFYKEGTKPDICSNCAIIHWPAKQIETKSYDLPVGVMSHDRQIRTLLPNIIDVYIPNNARLYKATKHFCSTVKVSLTKNRSLDCLLSNSLVAKEIQGMSQLISLCPAASKVPIRIIVEASSL